MTSELQNELAEAIELPDRHEQKRPHDADARRIFATLRALAGLKKRLQPLNLRERSCCQVPT